MNNDIERVLYSEEELSNRMDQMAQEITANYEDKKPLVVPVMTGAMMFSSEMLKRMNFLLNVDIVKASSYVGSKSTGEVKLVQDVRSDVKDRHVIFMEDIIDTGHTLKYLKELFEKRGAASVKICAMLDKPDTRQVDLQGDYVGFSAPDEFLVGYGLDYDGFYRNLPYIGVLKKSVYEK